MKFPRVCKRCHARLTFRQLALCRDCLRDRLELGPEPTRNHLQLIRKRVRCEAVWDRPRLGFYRAAARAVVCVAVRNQSYEIWLHWPPYWRFG